MKYTHFLLTTAFFFLLIACKQTAPSAQQPDSGIAKTPNISQVNISFKGSQLDCLLQQWYSDRYRDESPVVVRIINDSAAYTAFFPCSITEPLPEIDFTTHTLLIGMKADYGRFVNSPVNIRAMEQSLVKLADGSHTLTVKVTGQQSSQGYGGEWFAFMSVVPKITAPVKANMEYVFSK